MDHSGTLKDKNRELEKMLNEYSVKRNLQELIKKHKKENTIAQKGQTLNPTPDLLSRNQRNMASTIHSKRDSMPNDDFMGNSFMIGAGTST